MGRPRSGWTGPQDPWFGGVVDALDETVGEAVTSWIDGYRDRSYAARMTEISNRMHADSRTFVATSRPEPARPKRSRWRAIDEPREMDRAAMNRSWQERNGGHTGSDGVTTQRSGGLRELFFGRGR
jgi:hypothetical protein